MFLHSTAKSQGAISSGEIVLWVYLCYIDFAMYGTQTIYTIVNQFVTYSTGTLLLQSCMHCSHFPTIKLSCRPAPPQPERPSTPSPAEESAEKPAAGPVDVERKVKGMLEEVFNGGDDFKEGFLSIQELLDAGTDDRVIVEQCFNISLEMKGTDWDKFSAFLVQASESLSVSAMEGGSRQLLNKLDDLSVDVPKAPLQIGKVIANLIAADRLPTVAIMAKHIKEADAEPEEGEEPLAIGSGVAAKVLGTLLQSLKGHELDVAAAWKESGFAVLEFLPEEDRNDEGVEKFASTYDIADVLSA